MSYESNAIRLELKVLQLACEPKSRRLGEGVEGMAKQTDWSAEERKLQSAYEDLEAGRYKLADATVARWLKKHPRSQPALVLRACIIDRTGGDEESVLKALKDAAKTGSPSARSLPIITGIYQSRHRLDLCVSMFAKRFEENPTSPDIGEQLFLFAAAANDTATMVTASRKVFNLTKAQTWARVAAYSEWADKVPLPNSNYDFSVSVDAEALKPASVLFGMSAKTATTPDHLWLRLHILMAAGDIRQAWSVTRETVDGNLHRLYARIQCCREIYRRGQLLGDKWEWRGDFCRIEQRWALDILEINPDAQHNYVFYEYLLWITRLAVVKSNEYYPDTQELLLKLQQSIGLKERAPALALLSLQKAMLEDNHSIADPLQKWKDSIHRYAEYWGHKGPFLVELENILPPKDDERRAIIDELLESWSRQPNSDVASWHRLLAAQVWQLRHAPEDWTPSLERVQQLWSLYEEGLIHGKNIAPKTDVQIADPAGHIAAQLAIEMWHRDRSNEQILLRALLCARRVAETCPIGAETNFLLAHLYRVIGASSLAVQHVAALQPAEIQLDTILHKFIDCGGGPEAVLSSYVDTWMSYVARQSAMWHKGQIDLSIHIRNAIGQESFSAVPSLRKLHRGLARSLGQASTAVEAFRLEILASPGGDLPDLTEYVDMANAGLEDLRDWELMPDIGGKRPQILSMIPLGEVTPITLKQRLAVWDAVREIGDALLPDQFPDTSSLSKAEQDLYAAIWKLLRRGNEVFVLSGEQSETNLPLDAIYDTLAARCLQSPTGTRWEQLQPFIHVAELRAVIARLISLLGPVLAQKGKKRAPIAVELERDLQKVEAAWKERISPAILAKLDEMLEADDHVVPLDLAGDLLDVEWVHEAWRDVKQARRKHVEGLQKLLRS